MGKKKGGKGQQSQQQPQQQGQQSRQQPQQQRQAERQPETQRPPSKAQTSRETPQRDTTGGQVPQPKKQQHHEPQRPPSQAQRDISTGGQVPQPKKQQHHEPQRPPSQAQRDISTGGHVPQPEKQQHHEPQRPPSQAQRDISREQPVPETKPGKSQPHPSQRTQPSVSEATRAQGIQRTMQPPSAGRGWGKATTATPPELARTRGPQPPVSLMQVQAPVVISGVGQPGGPQTLPSQQPPPSEPREVTSAAQLARQIEESLSIAMYEPQVPFVRRPGKGTIGRKFNVVGNHFKIQLPGGNVYHYDVTITPIRKASAAPEKDDAKIKKMRPLSLNFNRKIFEEFRKTNKEFNNCFPVYDGNKNLFTRKQLSGISSERTFILKYKEEEKDRYGNPKISEFKVVIKPVTKKDRTCAINLDSLHGIVDKKTTSVNLDAVMAIEVILRHCPSLVYVPVGRSLYKPPSSPEEIYSLKSGGLDIWFGYHQSVHIGESGMFLNIDRAATAFYPAIPLLDLVFKTLNLSGDARSLREMDIKFLSRELKNLKVRTKHSIKRKYTIRKFSDLSAKDATFTIDDRKVSVEKYFREKYNVRLNYPLFPCIEVGNPQHQVLLPLEVCDVVENQPHRTKLTGDQTSEIIRLTAVRPSDRFAEITKKVYEVDKIIEPVKKEFGIQIDKKPHRMTARKLPAPFVVYNGNQKVNADQGFWDLRNSRLYEAKYSINEWVIISFAFDRFCQQRDLENFAFKLKNQANRLGIRMEECKEIFIAKIRSCATSEINFIIKKFISNYPSLQLAIFVLKSGKVPEIEKPAYSLIKKIGDVDQGLRTQCVLDKNAKKADVQLIVNLLQKINAKMGGINSTFVSEEKLRIFLKPVIIIGADVNHPAPGDKVKPSIAALVGSLDAHPSRYAATIRLQMRDSSLVSRLEIIQELRGMIKDVLKEFFKATRVKPEKVIFFRDGVSEGQFQEVLDKEIDQIKLAFKDLSIGATYNPPLTFVIIQKRHHTRLMPSDHGDGVGRCGNIPPGTTVDTDIVHPLNFDYYQCSHFGIQGTSRPTKYTVLYDDNKFTADEIQKLTHHLCHIYMRCTRSISLPAPVQYAHLAAFRAKEHLAALNLDTDTQSSGSGEEILEIPDAMLRAVKLNDEFKRSMYFV